jgi:hypothetical protein
MDSCKNLEKAFISIQLKIRENHSSYIFNSTHRNSLSIGWNYFECLYTPENISVVQSAFFRFSRTDDRICSAHSLLDYQLEKKSIRFFTFRAAVFQAGHTMDQLYTPEK